jgi:hypothetical protein
VSPTLLQPDEIASILRARHWITANDQVRLLPDLDGASRRGAAPGVWFKIARDLDGLAQQARQFHEACPEIAAKPLFFFEEGGWQWFGCEHDELSQELRDDQMAHASGVIDQAFAATDQPSTGVAAEAEIDAFLATLCQLPEFSLLDREMLTRYVGNELKATLVQSQPHTRWAHGNLTTDAIRVDREGRVRLQAPEFASRTHFYAEDWLRLGSSNGPPPPLRAYSWLREILRDPRSVRPNLLRALKILDGSGRALRQSLLAQTVNGSGPPLPVPGNGRAQLYASQTEAFSEDYAVTLEVSRCGWQCGRFVLWLPAGNWNLRLDPATDPGLTEIQRISVHSGTEGELFSSDQPGRILTASGTCVALNGDSLLRLLSYGNDPQVRLPRIRTHSDGELVVEVWMQWRDVESALAEVGPTLISNSTSVP